MSNTEMKVKKTKRRRFRFWLIFVALPIVVVACSSIVVYGVYVKKMAPGKQGFEKGLMYARLDRHAEAVAEFKKALIKKPDNGQTHYYLGYSYLMLKEYESAENEFKMAIKLKPDYFDAYIQLAVIKVTNARELREQGAKESLVLEKLSEGEEICLEIIKAKEDFIHAYLLLGEIHTKQGFDVDAIGDYKKALSIDNSKINAHIAIIELYMKDNKNDLAEKQCKEALSTVDQDNYQIRMLLSSIYDKQGKSKEATAVLMQTLEKRPDDVLVHSQLSVLYLKVGKYDDAFNAAETALKLATVQPLPPVVHLVMGVVLIRRKEYEKAVVQLTDAGKKLPTLSDSHYYLGIALIETGRKEQAITEFQAAINLSPEFVPAKLTLANILAKDGNLKGAIDLGNDVLFLDPKSVPAMQIVGMSYLKLKDYKAAEKQFNNILKLNPGLGDVNMALLSLESGQLSKCIKQCKDIIRLSPNEQRVYDILGLAYVRSNEVDKGIEQFIKAQELDSNAIHTYLNLAKAYILSGKNADAVETLVKLISLTPGNLNARVILANLYKNEGDIKNAIDVYEKILAAKSDYTPGYALASLYLLNRDTEKSLKLFDKALNIVPENALLYSDFAVAYQQDDNLDASLLYSKKAVKLKPDIRSFSIVMANIYAAAGAVDKAKEQIDTVTTIFNDYEKDEYKVLIDLFQKDAKSGKQAALAINRAIVARQKGFLDIGIDECKEVATLFPDNQIPKILLAGSYLAAGHKDEAVKIYNGIVKDKPEFVSSYHGLGEAYILSERQDDAIAIYRNLLTVDKESVSVRLTLARLLLKQGSTDEAIKLIEEATFIDPESKAAHGLLGMASLKESKYELAMKEFTKTLDMGSSSFEGHFNLARVKFEENDIDSCIGHCKAGLQLRPSNVHLLNLLGVAYLRKGFIEKAVMAFNKIIDIDAKFIPAYTNLAKIKLKEKDFDAAVHLYKKAQNIEPGNLGARIGLGNVYTTMGKHQEAVETYESVRQSSPDNVQVYVALANSFLNLEKYSDAREVVKKAIDLSPGNRDARYIKAWTYIKENNVSEAIKVLELLQKDFPAYLDAYILGVLYLDSGHYDKSISVFNEGLKNIPDNGLILSNLSVAYLMKNDYKRAQEAADKAFKIRPLGTMKNLKVLCAFLGKKENRENQELSLQVKEAYHLSRAIVYFNNKLFKRSLNEYENIIKILPSSLTSYNTITDINLLIGENDKAISACKKMVELDPDSEAVHRKLATVYVRAGRMVDAEQQFKKITEMNGSDANAWVNLGIALQSNGKMDESIMAYKKSVDLKPSAIAYNNLAWLYLFEVADKNGFSQAVVFAEKAKELSKGSSDVIDTLGWAYYLSGKYDKALEELESVIKDEPWNSTMRYHLGMAYYKNGMNRLALQELEKAIDIDPEFPEADDAKVAIQEMIKTK